jgi:hypothetical protein
MAVLSQITIAFQCLAILSSCQYLLYSCDTPSDHKLIIALEQSNFMFSGIIILLGLPNWWVVKTVSTTIVRSSGHLRYFIESLLAKLNPYMEKW